MLFANQRAKGQLDMIWKSNNLWISQNICEKKAEVKLYRIKFWPIKVPGIAKKNKRKWDMSFSSIQLLSHVQLFATPRTAECQASLSITNSQSLLKTHVHWVSDAIQPSHPLSSPSPPAFNLSQHQGLFQWINSTHEMAKVLEFQLQHQSFQWIFRTDFLSKTKPLNLQNFNIHTKIYQCCSNFLGIG